MCEKCKEIDRRLEEKIAELEDFVTAVEGEKAPGRSGPGLHVPSLMALALVQQGIFRMVERDECNPVMVFNAVMHLLEPVMKFLGAELHTGVAKDTKEAEELMALALGEPANKQPA